MKRVFRLPRDGHFLAGDVVARKEAPCRPVLRGLGDGAVTIDGDGERKAAARRRCGMPPSAYRGDEK